MEPVIVALDMSVMEPKPKKPKLCVARGVMNQQTGQPTTGVFTWTGKTWRTATITGLVKELPPTITDAELRAEYVAAVKAQRAGAV